MPVSGVNNFLGMYNNIERNQIRKKPTTNADITNPDTANNSAIVENRRMERNNNINNTNTDNRNITDLNNRQKTQINQPVEKVQRDQGPLQTMINNIQKMPNGMDNVQQAVIQGYKGVNRLA